MHRSKTSWAPSSVAAGVADFQEPRLPLTWDGVDARVETIRPSKSIPKQLMPAWFVCTRMVKKLRLLKGGSVPTFLVLGRCCTTSLPWTLEEGRRGSQAILDTAG